MTTFNLVEKREIAIDFEMRNEVMVAMFGDDSILEMVCRKDWWKNEK